MSEVSVFPARLKSARLMKGYSMDELCAAMGHSLSKMAISRYEKGTLLPGSTALIALSKALDQPVDYFFRPLSITIDSVSFRKKSGLPKKREVTIQKQVADMLERYVAIEEICGECEEGHLPARTAVVSCEQAKGVARRLREEWGLGKSGIVNVIEMLERYGVKVLEIEADDSFDGMSTIANGRFPVIVLNGAFSSERKRFTALHELGHLVMAMGEGLSPREQESVCHAFAGEMLIPESELKCLLGQRRERLTLKELADIQKLYGISCDALMYKAKSCGIIREGKFRAFRIRKNVDVPFKEKIEASRCPQERSDRFSRLVYNALSRELITLSKAAGLLCVDMEGVREGLNLI